MSQFNSSASLRPDNVLVSHRSILTGLLQIAFMQQSKLEKKKGTIPKADITIHFHAAKIPLIA